MENRSLVVSIHDVSPLTWKKVDAMLQDIQSLGVLNCSLLVIPDHHHKGHFLEDEGFCSWLLNQAQTGHEPVVHGYYHQRERKESDNLLQKLITQVYTADEGEFYDISQEQALGLLTKAQRNFHSLNLTPKGFIAPAWLLGRDAERALRKLDFQYTVRLRTVTDLTSGSTTTSQSLVYSVRSLIRTQISLGWNAFLFKRLQKTPLMRISLHPPDFDVPSVWKQILEFISLALEDRIAITYEGWVTLQRVVKVEQ